MCLGSDSFSWLGGMFSSSPLFSSLSFFSTHSIKVGIKRKASDCVSKRSHSWEREMIVYNSSTLSFGIEWAFLVRKLE